MQMQPKIQNPKYSLKHSHLSIKVFVFGQRWPQLILKRFLIFNFLATLVALHFTPVSESVGES